MMDNNNVSIESRRGSAPLELALVLPVLVMTGMLLLYVGRVSIVTVSEASTVRNSAWAERPHAPQPDILRLDSDPLASMVADAVQTEHPRWSGITQALPENLGSQTSMGVVAGTWGSSNVSGWGLAPGYWAPHGSFGLRAQAMTQADVDKFAAAITSRLNPAIVGGGLAVQKDLNSIQIILGNASAGGSVGGARNVLATLGLVVDSMYLASIGLERRP